MLLKKDIWNELREISPVLADMPYVNVYTVDQSYFQGIEAELFARIAADQFAGQKSFTVPEGYFDGLAGSILQKIKVSENTGVENESEYVSPVLAGISNKNVYSVPQGYFKGLQADIISKIKPTAGESAAAEIKTLSPVLARIGNENIYTVPQGYFEELRFTEAQNIPAKIIRMNPARSVFKYAAAAVITGLLGISVINIVDKAPSSVRQIQVETPSIAMAAANDILKKGDLDQELNNLSDKDIDQFLQESGQDVKAALVASSANDEAKLPQAEDYILDEHTLDNYLKQNNLEN